MRRRRVCVYVHTLLLLQLSLLPLLLLLLIHTRCGGQAIAFLLKWQKRRNTQSNKHLSAWCMF
jgi:hypothetical protein